MMETDKNQIWIRFKSNKVAMAALIFICVSFLMSVFAYFIIPDQSPNANQQFNTIALKEPGFSTQVLQSRINKIPTQVPFLQQLLHGKPYPYQEIAYLSIQFNPYDVQITNHFNRPEFYSYADILYHLDGTKVIEDGEYVIFQTLDHGELRRPISELKESVMNSAIHKKTFLLGTDKFGRDILSRIILGIRISVFVGVIAVLISLFVGVTLGAIAGYFGGWIDRLIMLIVNVNWSIPTLLMVFAIVLAFDRGISVIFIAVGLTMWVEVARVVRGQVKSLKNEQFVLAAQNLGFSSNKIIFQHILPNVIGPILVLAATNFSTAVLVEAGLSYLGFGVEPPTPSIGNMLNEHYGYALTGKVFLALVPAITIMLLVLSFNLVGTGLRDAFDVKRQEK